MSLGRALIVTGLLGAMCLVAAQAQARSITIDSADTAVANEMYVVNANIEFDFSDDALAAMRSGIALFIDVEIAVTRRRRFMWDPKILTLSRRYQIERHALTDRYVVTDLVTDDRRTHDSIEAAIEDLGRIRDIPVIEVAELADDSDYEFAIRASLDLDSLPAPLRPIAIVLPGWRMSSGWYQWKLIR